MGEIDWNAELRKIEREFDGLPPVPTAEERRARREAGSRSRGIDQEPPTVGGATTRLVLIVALAVAINFWPYGRSCGFGLAAFLGAQIVLVTGGLLTAFYTWRGRMARAHTITMLVILWGLGLLAAQVLPRVGYAHTPAGAPAAWFCGGAAP